ncbi:hypothetical protein SYNPS1DRAFT_32163 [Syncephalis pseudoplumigaleata]|uniref:Uncharacterized protein n=1 Tax=Syncephalis pseudoplumigaleata TaxID=1712513 RepID=A0A4P9YT06_9FUNG|nr:hypothetical protein SYNPS1DRAFT_32163 [Syncephalis pseudoplumigaleata]|eukprot:RKP22261.1 hypothetical protein SYNPS1DRAFT_32163 [Syncephalis pseudoplumigaleata]
MAGRWQEDDRQTSSATIIPIDWKLRMAAPPPAASSNTHARYSPPARRVWTRSTARSPRYNAAVGDARPSARTSYGIHALLLLLLSMLSLLAMGVHSQDSERPSNASIVIPCAGNLTCPGELVCYLADTGLSCLPPSTVGCQALPLPAGNYYTGPIVGIGAACQRCPLPGSTAQMQLLVDRYQRAVPGRRMRATLAGLGNCGPDAYCDDAQACRWKKKVLAQCDSSEECDGFCVKNDEAGHSTCYDPRKPQAEALQRLMYFGIFFGISVGLLLLAALACLLAGETRQRKEFRMCFVVTMILALALMGVAVYWEASPWPFSG